MDYFNPVEVLEREELENLKLKRLQETVDRLCQKVSFYRKKLDKAGFRPGDMKSLDDLNKLPFTTKDDLRDNYPSGLFSVPMREMVRIHASSGTMGRLTAVGCTAHDIRTWADLVARTTVAAGGTPDDIVHVAYGYGLFTGGPGLHYGAEMLGTTAFPMSGGNTKRQIRMMVDFGRTILWLRALLRLEHRRGHAGDGGRPGRHQAQVGDTGGRTLVRRDARAVRGSIAYLGPTTYTDSPRWWGRGCPSSARKRKGSTCSRIASYPR